MKRSMVLTALTCALLSFTLHAEPVELMPEGDFENPELVNRRPGWEVSQGGLLELSDRARTGNHAVRFVPPQRGDVRQGSFGLNLGGAAFTHGIRVQPGATYLVSVWARGRGAVSLRVMQWSTIGLGADLFPDTPPVTLSDEWQPVRVIYTPDDPRVQRVNFMVHLEGEDAEAWFDDAAFVFDPAANPDIQLEGRTPPTRSLDLRVESRDAGVTLAVNGSTGTIRDGEATVTLTEGLQVLSLQVRREGPNPAIRILCPEAPGLERRWRVSTAAPPEAHQTPEFDDGEWPVVTVDADGWIEMPDTDTTVLRQTVIWNASHHQGPQRWIIPPMPEWGFAQSDMETLIMALYSPLPYPLEDAEFVLEVPEAFRLLSLDAHAERHIFNMPAEWVREEPFHRDNALWRRYRIHYPARMLRPDQGQYTTWPVVMETPLEPGSRTEFRLRRHARGNVTELDQVVPVHILPPINGRRPQSIHIAGFAGIGYWLSMISDEFMDHAVAQAGRAGFNQYSLSPRFWGEAWERQTRRLHDRMQAHGARTFFLPPFNYPLHGAWLAGHIGETGAVYRWAMEQEGARARYFGDQPPWTPDNRFRSHLCPTFVVEHADEFRALLREDYEPIIREFMPAADGMFIDFERHPWERAPGGSPDGTGSRCFCERCKQAFRETESIPDEIELTDAMIFRDYYEHWEVFWNRQQGAMIAVVGDAGREMGLEFMLYSWAWNRRLWNAVRGRLDIVFAGLPGDRPADHESQSGIDSMAKYYREEVQAPTVIGQRFGYHFLRDRNRNFPASGNVKVLTHSGFFEPATWKGQVLRVVAATGGGIDLRNPMEYSGGALYYIGEATRVLAAYEPFFLEGVRRDGTIASDDLVSADRLALEHDGERLILLFNETDAAKTVHISIENVPPNARIRRFESDDDQPVTDAMAWEIPPQDVTVLHVTAP